MGTAKSVFGGCRCESLWVDARRLLRDQGNATVFIERSTGGDERRCYDDDHLTSRAMRPVASCSARVERRSSLQAADVVVTVARARRCTAPARRPKVPPATQWFAVQLRMRPPFLDPHVQLYSEHDSNAKQCFADNALCKTCALQTMCFANHVLINNYNQHARFVAPASSLNTMPSDESDIEETMHDTAASTTQQASKRRASGLWHGPFYVV